MNLSVSLKSLGVRHQHGEKLWSHRVRPSVAKLAQSVPHVLQSPSGGEIPPHRTRRRPSAAQELARHSRRFGASHAAVSSKNKGPKFNGDTQQVAADHCASFAGQVILAIAYGIDVAPHGDRNVEVAEKAVGAIIAGSLRGRIFDLFPFRTYGSQVQLIS